MSGSAFHWELDLRDSKYEEHEMFGAERRKAYGALSIATLKIVAIYVPGWIRMQQENGLGVRLCPGCSGSGFTSGILDKLFCEENKCRVCKGYRFLICEKTDVTQTDLDAINLAFERETWLRSMAEQNKFPAVCLDCSATYGPISSSSFSEKKIGGCSKCNGMGFLRGKLVEPY
jgi:Zn-finger nucleic acid-binding protein